METMKPGSPCIRCLIADLPDEAQLAELIRQRIELLPPEERTTEEERQERLGRCRRCEHLNHGTCVLCGCYVEIRTARRRMGCPDVPERWGRTAAACDEAQEGF